MSVHRDFNSHLTSIADSSLKTTERRKWRSLLALFLPLESWGKFWVSPIVSKRNANGTAEIVILAGECPPVGRVSSKVDDVYYWLPNGEISFPEANNLCQRNGMILANVSTFDKLNQVLQTAAGNVLLTRTRNSKLCRCIALFNIRVPKTLIW